jgi:hypothetical protein
MLAELQQAMQVQLQQERSAMRAKLQQAMQVQLQQERAAMLAELQQAMEVRLQQERAELVDGGLKLSEELRSVKAAVRALEHRQETHMKMSCSQQARYPLHRNLM